MKKTRKILIFCIACAFAFAAISSMFKSNVKLTADESSVSTGSESYGVSDYEKYISEKTQAHTAKYGSQTLTPSLSSPIVVLGQNYKEKGCWQ